MTSSVAPSSEPLDLPPLRYYGRRPAWQVLDPREAWHCRELIWILALRDIKVRYKQTVIGVAWAVLQPLVTLAVFAWIFGLLGNMPSSGETPYVLVALSGIVTWQYLAGGLMEAARSMIANRNLITKVYFPRVVLLLASKLAGTVDLAIGILLLAGVCLWLGHWPGWHVLFLPVFLLLAALVSLGISLWLSALNAIYRDVEYAVPFVLQTGFFLSPVTYATTALIPESWRLVYSLNPAVCVLEGIRWCLAGKSVFPTDIFFVSLAVALAILVSGAWYFQRMERHFADRV